MSFVPYEDLRKNFSLALGFGLVGTSILTFGDFNPLASMAPPIIAMVFYYLWFQDKSRLQSQVEQFADSFYYLGFLFTLGALAVSLIPWAFDSVAITPESVISKLGIALLTTIIGLGGRVYLTQFLASEEEAIADIQKKLRDGSRALAAELDLIVENFRDIRKKGSAELEAMIEQSSQTMQKSIVAASAGLSKSLEDFNSAVKDLSFDLKSTKTTVSDFRVSLSSTSASANQLMQELGTLANLAGTYQDRFKATLDGLNSISTSTEAFLNKLESLDDASSKFENLSQVTSQLTQAINKAAQALGKSANDLQQITSSANEYAKQLATRNHQHDRTLAKSVEMIQQTQESLVEAVKIATHKLDNS